MRPGPGVAAWLAVGLSLLLPVVGLVLGLSAAGETPSLARLYTSVAVLFVALVVGVLVHAWGLIRGLSPTLHQGWLVVCGLGLLSGVVTLVAAVVVLVSILKE
jgi:TRAP-type uncharacterized transport system fused permease subunit